jgi:hypothetical protein
MASVFLSLPERTNEISPKSYFVGGGSFLSLLVIFCLLPGVGSSHMHRNHKESNSNQGLKKMTMGILLFVKQPCFRPYLIALFRATVRRGTERLSFC